MFLNVFVVFYFMGNPKLLWDVVSDPIEQVSHTIVVIDNPDRRMINRLQQLILEEFAPTDNFWSVDKKDKEMELNYRLISFDTYEMVSEERLGSCYDGKIKRDTELYVRKTTGRDGLVAYVEKKLMKD